MTRIPGVHTALRRGEDTLLPNWALDAMERLTLAADIRILTFLTRHRAYRSNTYTTRQIAIALEIDPRTVQASTVRLNGLGLILTCDGQHCSAEAASRVRLPATTAQATRKPSASPLQKDSHQNAGNAVQDNDSASLNKGRKEERKASYASSAQASGQTPEKKTDEEAVQFFHGLCGYGFVSNNRDHLARWFDAYSPDFLRLAWRLGPTLKAVKVPQVAFIWLLNREKPWPDALQRQYTQDQQTPEGSAPDAPFIGEIRVMRDGRSGRVTEVDAQDRKLTLQIGEDDADALWVPWSVTEPAVRRSA